MPLAGIWHGGHSGEVIEDMANTSLRVMHFIGISLKEDISGRSVLSRFRIRLTSRHVCLLEQIDIFAQT